MLFDYQLEGQKEITANTVSFTSLLTKYWAYLLISCIAVCLVVAGFSLGAAIFGGVAFISMKAYALWSDISSICFTTDLSDFTLRDVINDLECR